jgi:hypothetical protein
MRNKVEVNEIKFICEFCNNEFKSKRNLQSHTIICREKEIYEVKTELEEYHLEEIRFLKEQYLEEIRLLKEQHLNEINENKIYIATLEAKLEIYERDHNVISDIAKQTKITNTSNIINNLAVYDIDKIREQFSNKLEYITKEDIINGQKGIANILAPCLYDENGTKMLTCTDKSRLIFTKVDDKNNKIKDSELKNLASVIKPLALKKADEIVEEHNKLKEQIYNVDSLKMENKEYEQYIKRFQDNIDNYKKTNINSKAIPEYESKIRRYKECILKNEELIANYEENEMTSEKIEDENEKLLDGHTEIQYLDKETAKFARHMSKIF